MHHRKQYVDYHLYFLLREVLVAANKKKIEISYQMVLVQYWDSENYKKLSKILAVSNKRRQLDICRVFLWLVIPFMGYSILNFVSYTRHRKQFLLFGWEPWSRGQRRWLIYRMLWVGILALERLFHINLL